MGTPHPGADLAKCVDMVVELCKVLRLPVLSPDTDLFKDLQAKSRTLKLLSADFVERGACLQRILSFYETIPIFNTVVSKSIL